MFAVAKKQNTILGKQAATEASVAQFIPYTRLVDNEIIKTKEGYYLKIIQIEGMPFETVDEIDINQRKNIRATLLRGLSNSRFAVYHHIIRREEHSEQDGFFENDFCRALDGAYQERLSHKRMFVNEQYITVVRRPAQGTLGVIADFSRTLFTRIDRQLQKNQEAEDIKALKEATAHILTTLSPYKPRVLGLSETEDGIFAENLSFLSYLINFEKSRIKPPRMCIADYLPAKRVSFGKEAFEIRGSAPGDVKIGAMLSLKEYADATGPGMLDSLLRLPHEFILTQSFGFVDRQASLNAMRDTQRKLMAGEQGATSLEEDLDDAIDDLASGKSTFGEHHLTITAIGRSSAALDIALSDCVGALVKLGIVTVREDINLEPAYWAQLPGNFSFIARRSLISNANFAGFASFHNFPAGRSLGNHWGPAITRLETTSGTPYWFNFHERDVGNFTVIGPTGYGKTVLLTFLSAQAQRLKPKTIYFDKDHGAEIYLRAIGGNYTTVRQGVPTGLNPLQLPDNAENRAFIRDWIRLLVTLDNSTSVTPDDLAIIADAVNATFDEPPKHRRLRFLAELLSGHEVNHGSSLSARMAKWHSGGERAWLFDNEQDTLTLDNKNIGFDLTSILDDKSSRTPWLMYIFHRVQEILDGQKVIIMLDEGWKLLDDPAFSARIKDWMKTIRKQNGIIGFATQSVRDALRSSVGDAIIEQSPTQIFLPNPRADENDYCKGFGVSKHELKIIRKLTAESRCFLLKHGTDSMIAKLDLTGLDDFIAVLSGRAQTVQFMHDLIQQYGAKPEEWLTPFIEGRKAL